MNAQLAIPQYRLRPGDLLTVTLKVRPNQLTLRGSKTALLKIFSPTAVLGTIRPKGVGATLRRAKEEKSEVRGQGLCSLFNCQIVLSAKDVFISVVQHD